mgnify:CR=1 FL=1
MRVEELYCVSLMAFSSEICSLESQEKVQRMVFEEFKKHQRFDLAIFSLRCLIFFTKSAQNKEYYEK